MRICRDLQTGKGCGTKNEDTAEQCGKCGLLLAHALRLYNPGDRIRHYRIVKVIGYGEYGAVYEAQAIIDPTVIVALKETLHPNYSNSFRREFEALRQVEHANLPRYYGSFTERRRGYLVMDLVPGQSLHEVLVQQKPLPGKRREPLPESLVLGCYAMQLCEALRYLHGQEPAIIHRDIKPANVRVMPSGLVKLVDFGLLKQVGKETHPDIRGIGTKPYAPPEQYGGSGNSTDQRSDIYSLSAMLYHLLTGREPLSAAHRLGKTPDPLQPLRVHIPTISPHVDDAIMIGLSLSKHQRYGDIVMFKRALLDDSIVNLPRTLRSHIGKITSVSYNPNGQLLISASSDRTIRLWNAPEGRVLHILRGHSEDVYTVACSPDGRMLATGSGDRTVRLWRIADGAALAVLRGHSGNVYGVTWSPDGQALASVGDDQAIHLWRVAEQCQWSALYGHIGCVYSVGWNPDGRYIVSGSADQTVRLWDAMSGALLGVWRGHTGTVRAVAWSPNGQVVASGGDDYTVRIWQVRGGRLLHTLVGHVKPVQCIAFSPDGRTLASASADQTVRLWRVNEGTLFHVLSGHIGPINSLAYNPDGQTFVIGGDEKTIREWRAIGVKA